MCGPASRKNEGQSVPITYVVSITVDQANADVVGKEHLQILKIRGIHKVASLLKDVVNLGVGRRGIVEVHTEGVLGGGQVEEVLEVFGWGWVVIWVPDVVNAASRVLVVRPFDVVTAHCRSFRADGLLRYRGPVSLSAEVDLVETATAHEAGELHVLVNSVIDRFNAVRVVVGKLGEEWSLDGLVYDSVDYLRNDQRRP